MLNSSLSRKTWLAWVALGFCLLATVYVSLLVKQGIEQDEARQFTFTCNQITLKIQERLGDYALILRGGAALFAASKAVDRNEWRAYVEKLRVDAIAPGVQGIGFAPVIPAAELAAHIVSIRDEGFPGYTVLPPGERAIYAPVSYLEPFRDRNLRAFGYDMFSEPVRRAAMEQARDSGEAALSGKVELVQETGVNVQAGFLMFAPVYRNGAPADTVEQRRAALTGWVFSPYRMNDFMSGILRGWLGYQDKTIHLHIYNGLQATPATLLFDSKPANLPELHSLFYQQRTIGFNGHQWLLAFELTGKSADLNYAPAWAALAAGFALSGLLFSLMLSVINTGKKAVRIAERLTKEIKHNQVLLEESEFRWKFALVGTGDGLLDWNIAERTVFFSKIWKEMLGFDEDDIGNGPEELTKRIHPEDMANAKARLQDYLDGKIPFYINEYRIHCKDGSYKWILDHGMIVSRGEDGKPLRMIGTHRDITQSKRAELMLTESRDLLQTIIDAAPIRIFWKDRNLRYLGCNIAFAKDAGMTHSQDIIGKDDFQMEWADQAELYRADDKAVLESGIEKLSYDEPQTTPSGQTIWLRTSKVLLRNQSNEVSGLLGIYEDITERKLLEHAREEVLSRLQKIASRVPGVVYQYRLRPDGSSCMPFASEAIHEIFHLGPEEVREDASKIFALIHPDDYDEFVASIQKSAQDLTPWRLEYLVKFDDGTVRWLFGDALPEREADGSTLWHGFITDITERKQAEENLQISEERLRLITSSAQDAIIMLDEAGNITFWNEAAETMFGYAREEALGRNLHTTLTPPSFREAHLHAFPHFQKTGQGAAVGKILELAGLRKDGSEFPLELSLSAVLVKGVWQSIGIARDITRRKQAEAALRKISAAVEQSPASIVITDLTGAIEYVNPKFTEITGYTSAEVAGQSPRVLKSGESTPEVYEGLWNTILSGEVWKGEFHNKKKNGELFWEQASISPIKDDQGVVTSFVAVKEDITGRKQAEEKLHLAASVFTHAREGIMITSADGAIIDVNDAFCGITGYSRDEVLGRNPRLLSSNHQETEPYAAMKRDLDEKGHWYGELWNRRKNGEVYAVIQSISAVKDAQGNTRQYVALISDITPFKEHERQLEYIAHYDALTSLPNRVLLADRLHQGMAQARRRRQWLAVAFLDLDGFKAINDNYGHEAGDQLLIAVANSLKQTLREGDTIARIGGDEFVVILLDLADIETSIPMLTRLLAAAAQPVQFGELTLQVSASLGVTFYAQEEDIDADQLLRQSDQAMYQAKLEGKNRYHVFDAEQDSSIRGRHESLERIRQALAAGEFVLYYQPKVNMHSGKIIGAEALIRWRHPERGLLLPDLFLPVINNHPLSIEVGEWVINSALTQMTHWHAAGLDIQVSVNVGARQLQQEDFVERLRAQLAAHPEVMPCCFELEVLETSALEDIARVSHVIEACREFGVMFALDDFGTGYSSLTYLKRLPVAQLKIDQSFVRDMFDDPDNLVILVAMVSLATALHRQVIAEGVETMEHGKILLQLGCDLAQGYFIARPMPAHELPGWSAAWRPDLAWSNQPRVKHDDLLLLFASVYHQSWFEAVEAFLKGLQEAPPPLDIHLCHFGKWLNAEGLDSYDTQPNFQAIELLHGQAHALAAELCGIHDQGRNRDALARLGELQALRDALLEQLSLLLQSQQ